jgi:hypothetical protein
MHRCAPRVRAPGSMKFATTSILWAACGAVLLRTADGTQRAAGRASRDTAHTFTVGPDGAADAWYGCSVELWMSGALLNGGGRGR